MNHFSGKGCLDEYVARIEVALFYDTLSIAGGHNLLGGNQHLRYVVAKIGILDLCIKKLLDLASFPDMARSTYHSFFDSAMIYYACGIKVRK